MSSDAIPTAEAKFSARLHAVLGARRGAARLATLHEEARSELGHEHQLTLLIEYHLNYALGPGRPVEESLSIWSDLQQRARQQLPEGHPTVMAIRACYARCLSRRGHPGDLDRVVDLHRAEVDRRVRRGSTDDWIGVARADLAIALLDRARLGHFDPRLRERDADADVAAARELVEFEVDRRIKVHGTDHPFTWDARTVLGSVLLARAWRAPYWERRELSEEALALAEALGRHEWQRNLSHTPRALRGQLLRAEALLLLGRCPEAEGEARLAAVLARRYRGLDTGRALLVLAQALAARDQVGALASATEALRVRRAWFSAAGHHVAEAVQLVRKLRGDRTAGG